MEDISQTSLKLDHILVDTSPFFLWGDADDDFRSSSDDNNVIEVSDDQDVGQVVATYADVAGLSKKKKHDRRTPSQIEELEKFFKIWPHPDEKQRVVLGNKIGQNSNQVKFWFQNRRTQMKTLRERHENCMLKAEYAKLQRKNMVLKKHIGNPLCKGCGGEAINIMGDIAMEDHQYLRLENGRLKEELIRVCGVADKYTVSNLAPRMGGPGLENGSSSNSKGIILFTEYEKSMLLHVAVAAMDELVALSQSHPTFWHRNSNTGKEMFNHEAYVRNFNPPPLRFTYEATREAGSVSISNLELVNTLMNPRGWKDMFPCMIGKASTVSVIRRGDGGTHDGELLLMDAELLFPSPLVALRRIKFIRYCKNIYEGAWVVVDMSIDPLEDNYPDVTKACRRLPSGFCIVQGVDDGYSLVTCVEHTGYDEAAVHRLFRPLIQSGLGFGAQRWITTLQRQCEYVAFLPALEITPLEADIGFTIQGRRSTLKLSRRMVDSLCAGMCASSVSKWDKLNLGNIDRDVQVMKRVNINEPGEVSGIVLSCASSLWLPVSRNHLFDFLRNGKLLCNWDILVDVQGPMEETIRVTKSTDSANATAILCSPYVRNQEKNKVVLQETWSDRTISAVVYATFDVATITTVIEGGRSEHVEFLPSGFIISDAFLEPVASNELVELNNCFSVGVGVGRQPNISPSSFLTLAFQVLASPAPASKLSTNCIVTMKELMSQTIHKIKTAMCCN